MIECSLNVSKTIVFDRSCAQNEIGASRLNLFIVFLFKFGLTGSIYNPPNMLPKLEQAIFSCLHEKNNLDRNAKSQIKFVRELLNSFSIIHLFVTISRTHNIIYLKLTIMLLLSVLSLVSFVFILTLKVCTPSAPKQLTIIKVLHVQQQLASALIPSNSLLNCQSNHCYSVVSGIFSGVYCTSGSAALTEQRCCPFVRGILQLFFQEGAAFPYSSILVLIFRIMLNFDLQSIPCKYGKDLSENEKRSGARILMKTTCAAVDCFYTLCTVLQLVFLMLGGQNGEHSVAQLSKK